MIIEKEGYAQARASPMAQQVKNLPAMQQTQEMRVRSLGQEGPLEEKNSNPFQHSCLTGCNSKGCKESETTEGLSVRAQAHCLCIEGTVELTRFGLVWF